MVPQSNEKGGGDEMNLSDFIFIQTTCKTHPTSTQQTETFLGFTLANNKSPGNDAFLPFLTNS